MAETTADVRRDIAMTRERLSDTLQQLEHKTNVMQIVKDHPWPAIGLAVGAGVLLSGSRADVKAAAATATATRGASSRIGSALDDMIANLMGGLGMAVQDKVDSLVNELKEAIGAPTTSGSTRSSQQGMGASALASGSTESTRDGWSPSSPTGGAGSTGSGSSSGLGASGTAGSGYSGMRAD